MENKDLERKINEMNSLRNVGNKNIIYLGNKSFESEIISLVQKTNYYVSGDEERKNEIDNMLGKLLNEGSICVNDGCVVKAQSLMHDGYITVNWGDVMTIDQFIIMSLRTNLELALVGLHHNVCWDEKRWRQSIFMVMKDGTPYFGIYIPSSGNFINQDVGDSTKRYHLKKNMTDKKEIITLLKKILGD
jgi:hypothetical protein